MKALHYVGHGRCPPVSGDSTQACNLARSTRTRNLFLLALYVSSYAPPVSMGWSGGLTPPCGVGQLVLRMKLMPVAQRFQSETCRQHRAPTGTWLAGLFMLVAMVLLAATPVTMQVTDKTQQACRLLKSLTSDMSSFWVQHGLDVQWGGFHGTLDRTGGATQPYDKGLVQQARHMWTFSTLYMKGWRDKHVRQAADSAYNFLTQHMLDPSDGVYYWSVSRNGSRISDPSKNLYGNWFVIYGLAQYAKAFGSSAAQQHGLAAFRSVDRKFHDNVTKGYDETKSAPVFDSILLKNSTKRSKTFNFMLHAIEALGNLYKRTEDDAVKGRLMECLGIFMNKMILGSDIYANYDLSWKPVGDDFISYGHNLEAAWLLEGNYVGIFI